MRFVMPMIVICLLSLSAAAKEKKFLSFTMAMSSRVSEDNPNGWTEWGLDHDEIIEVASTLDRDEWHGIQLMRACGSHAPTSPRRDASRHISGEWTDVYPMGPSDTPYPIETAKALLDLGFEVSLFAGWPRDLEGFVAVAEAVDMGCRVYIDSSAESANGGILMRLGARPEPAPWPPSDRPEWWSDELQPWILADRARLLDGIGALPPHAMIAWNGNESGKSFYSEAEMQRYLDRGYDVSVPVGQAGVR